LGYLCTVIIGIEHPLSRAESAFGGELAKRGNRGPLTLRDGHSADSGTSEQTSRRYRIPT
jgi:hypothetical protein